MIMIMIKKLNKDSAYLKKLSLEHIISFLRFSISCLNDKTNSLLTIFPI